MARRKWNILMVDNDADYAASLKAFLEAQLGRILWAKTPGQAESVLADEKIDLLLLDIMLDEPDAGLRWARELKAADRLDSLPVFILSAADERFGLDLKSKLAEPGYCPARGFLDKGTPPTEIAGHLQKFLRSQRS